MKKTSDNMKLLTSIAGIIDINLFYSVTITQYQIRLQGDESDGLFDCIDELQLKELDDMRFETENGSYRVFKSTLCGVDVMVVASKFK